jgi:ATP-dependent RNA helicase DDX6/DHH1
MRIGEAHSLCKPHLDLLIDAFYRFNLYTIEQELGTEIMPIPHVIDRGLYVAGSAPPPTAGLSLPSSSTPRTSTPSGAPQRNGTPSQQPQYNSTSLPLGSNAAMIARAQGMYALPPSSGAPPSGQNPSQQQQQQQQTQPQQRSHANVAQQPSPTTIRNQGGTPSPAPHQQDGHVGRGGYRGRGGRGGGRGGVTRANGA